jgi:putative membrane protein insertion efficiency factor
MPTDSPTRTGRRAAAGRRVSIAAPVIAALLGLAVGDSLKPASEQWLARGAVATIDAYRSVVSPVLARSGIVKCRFDPTCSAYGREAIAHYGSPRGFLLAGWRILRCHPWAKGGSDPVPEAEGPAQASAHAPRR